MMLTLEDTLDQIVSLSYVCPAGPKKFTAGVKDVNHHTPL